MGEGRDGNGGCWISHLACAQAYDAAKRSSITFDKAEFIVTHRGSLDLLFGSNVIPELKKETNDWANVREALDTATQYVVGKKLFSAAIEKIQNKTLEDIVKQGVDSFMASREKLSFESVKEEIAKITTKVMELPGSDSISDRRKFKVSVQILENMCKFNLKSE